MKYFQLGSFFLDNINIFTQREMNQLVYTFFNKKYLINDNSYDISKKNIDELLIKYFGPLSKKFDYNKLLDLNDEKEIVLKVSDDIYRFYPRGVGV